MTINKDVILGKNVQIFQPDLVNLYGCEIGDDTKIGAFVEIKQSAKIGKKVKIQAGVFIPEGVIIEDEVFVGPHVVFTNDIYPRSTNSDGSLKNSQDWSVAKTLVKKKASIGANASILCGVTIGEGAMVGIGSVVTKNVPAWTIVAGNPAKAIRKIEDRK